MPAAILLAPGLNLFLELSVIRWHSTIFEFFALYKNSPYYIDHGLLETTGFIDVTSVYRNAPVLVDLPTDDWPFFYMAV